MTTTTPTDSLFVKMTVDAWQAQNARVEKLVNGLTDEQLAAETAPGRNTGTYLFGHLLAVNDRLFEALGWGGRLHPELDAPFLTSADKSEHPRPSIASLREYWGEVSNKLNAHIGQMQPQDWFTAHSTVSPEDFVKEPHRNKLNLLLSRTVHMSNHLGQMIFLEKK